MRRSQTFVKKTRKGAVLKVVKEVYLRDDVYCGSEVCKVCPQDKPVLSKAPLSSPKFKKSHYLLPDTNAFLHQVDVLQHNFFHDVIVLETVLEEVKHRSISIHGRIREMIADPERRFYVFLNEHHRETYIEREKDESPNDRNDRAIRTAALWFKEHLAASNLIVVLLTDDADNLQKAKQIGCTTSTVSAYVQALTELPELLDVLSQPGETYNDGDYDEYVDTDTIEAGLKTNKYVKGTFNISPYDKNEGFVWVHSSDSRVILEGTKNMNRSIQDDHVVVEMLPRSQWQRPSAKLDTRDGSKTSNGVALTIDEPMMDDKDLVPTGKVVGVMRRNWRAYCGAIIDNSEEGDDASVSLFVPVDRRIPYIRIRTNDVTKLKGKRIVAHVDAWDHSSLYPSGHYVRTIGDIGDRATETEVILLEYDIPHHEFSHAVMTNLPEAGDQWTVDEHGGHDERRRDLRHLDICSVDPPGCTDIDDALHVRKLENGNYEVGVHIADVTHFVRPGNAMDIEARHRGTTVYLVDKRIDMLPALLGTNLCSLHCDVDRFAFSCLWEMNDNADVISVDFCKSIIRSRASLTYDMAQERIDNKEKKDGISKSLRILNRLAKQLKASRGDKGALTLASPEVRFSLENNSQDPVDVEMKEMKDANSMVEEFMLLANISVARKIHQVFSQCSLLRRHAVPSPVRFEYLVSAAGSKGLVIDPSSSKTLAASLDNAVLPEMPYLNRLIRILTTRCMTQAQYICSGVFPYEQYLHYGLAADIYTHFTSPIRRYADVVVHRLLAAAVGADTTFPEMLDKDNIHRVCQNLNRRHKLAQLAGRGSVQLYTVLFFREKKVLEDAHIIRILQNGIVVLIPRFGIEGIITIVPSSTSTSSSSSSSAASVASSFVYDGVENRLYSEQLGVSFQLFDTVRVQIETDESNKLEMQLVISVVSPFIKGISPEPEDPKKTKQVKEKNADEETPKKIKRQQEEPSSSSSKKKAKKPKKPVQEEEDEMDE